MLRENYPFFRFLREAIKKGLHLKILCNKKIHFLEKLKNYLKIKGGSTPPNLSAQISGGCDRPTPPPPPPHTHTHFSAPA